MELNFINILRNIYIYHFCDNNRCLQYIACIYVCNITIEYILHVYIYIRSLFLKYVQYKCVSPHTFKFLIFFLILVCSSVVQTLFSIIRFSRTVFRGDVFQNNWHFYERIEKKSEIKKNKNLGRKEFNKKSADIKIYIYS